MSMGFAENHLHQSPGVWGRFDILQRLFQKNFRETLPRRGYTEPATKIAEKSGLDRLT